MKKNIPDQRKPYIPRPVAVLDEDYKRLSGVSAKNKITSLERELDRQWL